MDKYAAKLPQNWSALKKYLSREENYFVVLSEYGNFYNKQRYCIYEHLVLQMEDWLDWLKVLYPSFYFVFLFDRSCGHDRTREGILNASINKYDRYSYIEEGGGSWTV